MKIKKYSCILLLTAFIMMGIPFSCHAINSGFELENMDKDDIDRLYNLYDLKPIEEPSIAAGFNSFDVNENGSIAFSFCPYFSDPLVTVYDTQGNYAYGFSIDSPGDIAVEWDGDQLVIYSVRGNIAMAVDSTGDLIAMQSIVDSIENYDYWRKEVYAKTKTANGITYKAENRLGIGNLIAGNVMHSTLVQMDESGTETVLYDNSQNHMSSVISLYALMGCLFGIPICIIIIKFVVYDRLWQKRKTTFP